MVCHGPVAGVRRISSKQCSATAVVRVGSPIVSGVSVPTVASVRVFSLARRPDWLRGCEMRPLAWCECGTDPDNGRVEHR